jgi:hypothetical protein
MSSPAWQFQMGDPDTLNAASTLAPVLTTTVAVATAVLAQLALSAILNLP